jgi:uncharacterized protein (DUF1800 family)
MYSDDSQPFSGYALKGEAEPSQREVLRVLLGRISYGVRADELERAESIGYKAWVYEQLELGEDADAELEATLASLLPTLAMSSTQLVALFAEPQTRAQALRELQTATIARALYSRRQLFQMMVGFWSDWFNIYQPEGLLLVLKTLDDRDVVRANAFGSFRDILGASARSPAMLIYLDNYLNGREGINENYARELLELHTLGVAGGYDENDVVDVARCFSGWSLQPGTAAFVFRNAWHDFGAKRVLGVDIPAGGGISDGEAVLDLLAAHPSAASYFATRLTRRFVSDSPDPALVADVAAGFAASGGDIRVTLRTLLLHPLATRLGAVKTRRPQEYVLGMLRALHARPNEGGLRLIAEALQGLAHLPFFWPAPNGYPDVAAYWVNSNAMLNRWNFALDALTGEQAAGLRIPWASHLRSVGSAEALAARVLSLFPAVQAVTGAEAYWSGVAHDLLAQGPGDAGAIQSAAALLAALMAASEAFQWR